MFKFAVIICFTRLCDCCSAFISVVLDLQSNIFHIHRLVAVSVIYGFGKYALAVVLCLGILGQLAVSVVFRNLCSVSVFVIFVFGATFKLSVIVYFTRLCDCCSAFMSVVLDLQSNIFFIQLLVALSVI